MRRALPPGPTAPHGWPQRGRGREPRTRSAHCGGRRGTSGDGEGLRETVGGCRGPQGTAGECGGGSGRLRPPPAPRRFPREHCASSPRPEHHFGENIDAAHSHTPRVTLGTLPAAAWLQEEAMCVPSEDGAAWWPELRVSPGTLRRLQGAGSHLQHPSERPGRWGPVRTYA